MADKVKLTPPMTDSKTPEWVKEETSDLYDLVSDAPSTAKAKAEISLALIEAEQRGYERGRKEGREGVSEVERILRRAEEHAGTLPAKEAVKIRPADWHALSTAIRQLLEVKG